MDYLLFDLLAVALPATLLLRGVRGRRVPWGATLALGAVAVLWTGPWDEHLVRTGVWSSPSGAVLARIGAVPAEEYAFVLLQVLLVTAWGRRTGVLGVPAGPVSSRPRARRRGAFAWLVVLLTGLALAGAGGGLRYLGLLLAWVSPPLALQRVVAGDVLAARRASRAALVLPVAVWLAGADRVALALGTWAISPGSSTGVLLLGLPVEEALFFCLTSLLVADGLLLATDPRVLRRVHAFGGRYLARTGLRRSHRATARPTSATTGSAAGRPVAASLRPATGRTRAGADPDA
ncbi:MAG: lycopene cyclase domain-containing protein, partial [Mycobacteriales bacterium]